MKKNVKKLFLQKGFFPEVLPPCFDSHDLTRAFGGLATTLATKKFTNRSSKYIRYSGTKHDGNRRNYATANPVCYYSVVQFLHDYWDEFKAKFDSSIYTINGLRIAEDFEDRALIVPTLSELTAKASKQLKYSPYIVRADIAQFFPSIYTHSIGWAAHGIDACKSDGKKDSLTVYFNALDFFTRQCQFNQTRGVIIGPDPFRAVAEFVICEIDGALKAKAGSKIIGAIRHVDDFYIGVKSEIDGIEVLSHLRDVLQTYELQLNDSKTKILSGLASTDDLWAQELRALPIFKVHSFSSPKADSYIYAIDKAFEISQSINSESPLKLILRRFDEAKIYDEIVWEELEPKLQRIAFHFPHCIDYVCLLVAKRFAIKKSIDKKSWSEIIALQIPKFASFNHHHEIVWLSWLGMVCKLDFSKELIALISKVDNSHIKALLIAAFQNKLIKFKPDIKFETKLTTSTENWLHHLVARATGFSKAAFSGEFSDEFEHLAKKKVKLIDFKRHMRSVAKGSREAISRSRYGYDGEKKRKKSDLDDDDDDDSIIDWSAWKDDD